MVQPGCYSYRHPIDRAMYGIYHSSKNLPPAYLLRHDPVSQLPSIAVPMPSHNPHRLILSIHLAPTRTRHSIGQFHIPSRPRTSNIVSYRRSYPPCNVDTPCASAVPSWVMRYLQSTYNAYSLFHIPVSAYTFALVPSSYHIYSQLYSCPQRAHEYHSHISSLTDVVPINVRFSRRWPNRSVSSYIPILINVCHPLVYLFHRPSMTLLEIIVRLSFLRLPSWSIRRLRCHCQCPGPSFHPSFRAVSYDSYLYYNVSSILISSWLNDTPRCYFLDPVLAQSIAWLTVY